MGGKLENKIIAITGGAGGIGYYIADYFLAENAATTLLLDLNEEHGIDAERKLNLRHGDNRAVYLKCDITTDLHKTFSKILQTYKTIDILVNCAGITLGFQAHNEVINGKTIDINTKALILWSMKFWEYARKDKGGNGGVIINLASIYGFRSNPFFPVYQASKFAVVGFTKSLGDEYNYKRSGLKVLGICPSYTDTGLVADPKSYYDEEKLQQDVMEYLKNKVWQKPDAVARAAVDVLDQDSGTLWLVEGGRPIEQVLK